MRMQLFKSFAILSLLPALCACGGTEKSPAASAATASKPVVRYSRGGETERRRVIAAAALGESDGDAPLAPPSREVEREAPPSPAKPPGEPVREDIARAPALKAPAASTTPSEGPTKEEERAAIARMSPAERTQLLLEYLTGPVDKAQRAYKVLWSVDKSQIPSLVVAVDNKTPTKLHELDLLVLQEDFARYDEKNKRWFYLIKGMGSFEIDDIAMSKVSRPKGAVRVRLKRFKGFPLGVVLRAGLLNRFRSTRFPGIDDRKFIGQWWQMYYRLNASTLK